MSWTDERIDTLRTMWEAGQTASQIAEALGGVSRNAVIGKAHRLGLQLYSPYRRAVALRNLRWLLRQGYVPRDIRLKEAVKMLLKPWCWLALEPDRRRGRGAAGWRRQHPKAGSSCGEALGTANNQHPNLNLQAGTIRRLAGHWMLEVRCWKFDAC